MAGVPPLKNSALTFYMALVSQADTNIFQVNPTIAAGDFQVSIDGGAFNNPATLPVVSPAGSQQVEVALSAPEMNGDVITVLASDAVGAEWQDAFIEMFTDTSQIGTIATAITAAVATITAAITAAVTATCSCVTEWFAKTVSTLSTLVTGEVTIVRGDTLILQFADIGDISTRDNIWFTVKGDKDDLDTGADIQIDEDNGLLYINGVDAQAAGWAADASITVTDAVAGDLTVRLEAVQSAKITTCRRNWYDLQVSWADTTVSTLSKGLARIIGDLTRATS